VASGKGNDVKIRQEPRVRQPQDALARAADRLTDVATDPRRAWRATARSDQLLPPEPWRTLMLLGGRGSGKTRAGAQALAEMILGDPEPGEWGIVAPTYRDAWSTCVEGESGLLVALGTSMAKIRAGDCPIVASAARGYAEVRLRNGHVVRADSADDGALRVQGKNLKGVWCITCTEPVLTSDGWRPIQDVAPGSLVMTRRGWRTVTTTCMTHSNAEVIRVSTADGQSVSCTPEHLIWTQSGWTEAQNLHVGDIVLTWSNSGHPLQGRPPGSTGTVFAGTGKTRDTTFIRGEAGFTLRSGSSLPGESFLTGMSSTTSTTTRQTTGPRTFRRSPGLSTTASIAGGHEIMPPRPGSAQERKHRGLVVSRGLSPASGAGQYASHAAAGGIFTSAREELSATTLAVVTSVSPAGRSDVWDLTTDDAHEFFAGGILVHNCDELGLFAKWETAWDESIAYAVRKGSSKIIATGTPKVSRPAAKLIRRLTKEAQSDPAVIVRRLRTTDNLANLSETFFRSVVARSKGTRLERQELEGELLEDNDQALWSREVIERNRVEPEDVPDLIRVVIALDPAVTSLTSADETGIIVAGEAATGHGYVLADLSLRASPQRAMERAVAAYRQFNGDRIIGEANNGGDFIGALLKTVDPDVPYTKVTASRGKAVRAEPVSALYEQGRIHHAGVFVELEDELCTWAPGDSDSPDRLDACVWAISALKGLSRGSWADAYGIVTCVNARCGRGYLSEGRKACPHCGTPKPPEENAA
jgi:phage terminase large subunit-like protein